MRYRFEQARIYLGGFDMPWWATVGAVQSAGESEGFADIRVWKRADFPLPFAPPSEAYSHIALGRRVAPSASMVLPSEVAWVFDVSPPATVRPSDAPPIVPAPVPAPAAPPARGTPLFWLGYVGAAAAIVWGLGRVSRGL